MIMTCGSSVERLPEEPGAAPGRFRVTAWRFGHRFDIYSDSPETLLIVRSHLDHAFAPAVPADDWTSTRLDVDCGEFSEEQWLAATSGHPIVVVEGYAGEFWEHADAGVTRMWRRVSARDEKQMIIRGVEGWRVSATSPAMAALTAVRVCREILRSLYADAGGIDLHSALCFHPALGGVLFVGGSGAGKTTLALALAQQGGCVISSDQTTLLAGGSGELLGTALPNAHRIRAGTMQRLAAQYGDVKAPLLRERLLPFAGNPVSDKTWLTPLETEVLFSIPSVTAVVVDRVIFLSAVPGLDEPRYSPTWPERISGLLRNELRTEDPLHPAFWLTAVSNQPSGQAGVARAADLVARSQLATLRWDPQRHLVTDVIACIRRRPQK